MGPTKKEIIKLEQLYYTNVNEPVSGGINPDQDVPNVYDSKEYKTQIPIPPAVSDELQEDTIDPPVVKTRKGKNIIIDPPPEDSENEGTGDVISTSPIKNHLCKKDQDFDKKIISDKTVKEQDEKSEVDKSTEDPDISKIDQMTSSSMGEQNPASGENPNVDPSQADPNAMMGGDPTQADPNAMMGGMPGMEPPKTAEQIGRIFELKKIYSRLLAIQSQLSFSSDLILLRIRKFITKSIELFELLISNVDSFKEEIDSIIVDYYNFIQEVYNLMERYYKIKDKEDKEKDKK